MHMPDFEIINNALKAPLVRRLNDSNGCANWCHIPVNFPKPVGVTFLLKCNFDLTSLNVNIALPFYKEALFAWQNINAFTPTSKEEIYT